MNIEVTPRELAAIASALRIAAEQYRDDAQAVLLAAPIDDDTPEADGVRSIANQFRTQSQLADELAERLEAPAAEPPDDGCTNPGGHEWNRTAGEADEARIAGDYENDNVRCIHCGADGDA